MRFNNQILKENGVSSSRPFQLTRKGLDSSLLPAMRIQRATRDELKNASDAFNGESLSHRNEAEVCTVLYDALSSMLAERVASRRDAHHAEDSEDLPSTLFSAQSSTRDSTLESLTLEADGCHLDGDERRKPEEVLPEDRKRAVELLRAGEEDVLRFCLEYVEALRCQVDRQLE